MKEETLSTIIRKKIQINVSVNDHKDTSSMFFPLLKVWFKVNCLDWFRFFKKRSISFTSKPCDRQRTYTAHHVLWPWSRYQLGCCWLSCSRRQICFLKMNGKCWLCRVKTIFTEGEQGKENIPSPTFCPLSPHCHTLPYIWKGFCLSFLLFSGHSCLFLSTRSSRSSRTTLMIFPETQCQGYKPGLDSEMEMNLHEASVQRRVAQLPGRPL